MDESSEQDTLTYFAELCSDSYRESDLSVGENTSGSFREDASSFRGAQISDQVLALAAYDKQMQERVAMVLDLRKIISMAETFLIRFCFNEPLNQSNYTMIFICLSI